MNTDKQTMAMQMAKKLLHKAIKNEAADWPPLTPFGMYQPVRPCSQEKTSDEE